MDIEITDFGTDERGAANRILMERDGMRAVFTDVGARLLELHLPDRHGRMADVVLGYPDLRAHRPGPEYFGATCGRYANRIRGGVFELDGDRHELTLNEGANHLHGGLVGFDQHIWGVEFDEDTETVVFTHVSPHGDQGYPGELTAQTRFTLGDRTLDIEMTATSDRPTVVNLVNHAYWNLAGHDAGNVMDQLITIESDVYLPVDDDLLPTGEILTVDGSPFDLREGTPIGQRIREVAHAGAGRPAPGGFAGYDHCWAIRGQVGRLRPCATVIDPESGRRLDLLTDRAGLQFYTGGYIADVGGKHASLYEPFQGFTLETQEFPDSPNIGHFPSTVLRPGETYQHRMHFRFTTIE